MKKRQLLALISVALCVVLLGLAVQRGRQRHWAVARAGTANLLLTGLPVNEVARILVENREARVELVRKDGVWRVAERYGYPANFENIRRLLRDLHELKAVQTPVVGETHWSRLDLRLPEEGAGSGVSLTLFAGDGRELAMLILGKEFKRPADPGSPFAGQTWAHGRYLRVPKTGTVALVAKTFASVVPKPLDWLDKEFFKLGDVQRASLEREGGVVWTVQRASAAASWTLADAGADEKPSDSAMRRIGSAFAWASFNDVADTGLSEEDTGLDTPAATFRASTFDGLRFDISMGAETSDGSGRYIAIDVSADESAERVVDAGESAEDRERLDTEYRQKQDAAREKLDALRTRLDGWVYIVPRHIVDDVLKNRAELIEKPEPVTEPAAAAAAPVADDE